MKSLFISIKNKSNSIKSSISKISIFSFIFYSFANEYKKKKNDKREVLSCFKAEDKELKRVKNEINERIKNLEFKYKGTLKRQNVEYGIRGNRYYIEFNINQANVNPDLIVNDFLSIVNPKTQNSSYNINDKKLFRIIDQQKFEEDDLFTLKIDFENANSSVSHALCRGSFLIRGTFGKVYDNFVVTLEKQNNFNDLDIDAFLNIYENLFRTKEGNKTNNSGINKANNKGNNNISGFFNNFHIDDFSDQSQNKNTKDDPLTVLNKHGVIVYQPGDYNKNLEWNYLAGYENVKRKIEDSILLGLTHGEIYDQITQGTRVKFETNRPKAILFEGPPGCGKTTSAKIIANQVNVPLIYMPLEAIMSKWYGESENKFSDIFEAAKALGKSIIFIDEIDALATSREGGIHEATRRILSTLLRKIDGFESDGEVLVICATNRRKDLDPALLSRLDNTITFELPDDRSRALIFQRYAKQLKKEELEKLAEISNNFSGRDISEVCKDCERGWASKYIRKEVKGILPTYNCYEESLLERKGYMYPIKVLNGVKNENIHLDNSI